MDLLASYGDEAGASSIPADEPREEEVPEYGAISLPAIGNAAPDVDTTGLALVDSGVVSAAATRHLQDARAKKVYANLPVEQMHAPVVGPDHPHKKGGIAGGMRNHWSGHVEDHHAHSFHFDDQHNTFHSLGYAQVPGASGYVVGDERTFEQLQGESVYAVAAKRQKTAEDRAADAAKRVAQAAQRGVAPQGPFELLTRQPWADKEVAPALLNEEQKAFMEQVARDKEEAGGTGKATHEPKSHFHGKEVNDYQGRSWLEPPKGGAKPENDYCFLPKRWVHTWSGHTKGVNAIRFFPGTGHLLLSAGLDGKVKIWDVPNTQKCMRTYMGHSKGVRDITFSNDGRRFLSTSYDKAIRLWDTETGQVIRTIGEGKMHYCVRFHPDEDKQNVLMAGGADKKIYQFDLDTGDLVQEYDYHLAAINSITFVDEGRRFVSTSDDKTIRVWEFGIPVQIKYIADPSMHSMPAVALSPNAQWMIGTSLDNQILTYAAKDRFRQNRKKVFKGHTVAGYACQPNFSPDGRYVISGDGEGKLWIWDWKTCKAFRTIKAHEGVAIDAQWHPTESSKVATAGWDGLIKYWD